MAGNGLGRQDGLDQSDFDSSSRRKMQITLWRVFVAMVLIGLWWLVAFYLGDNFIPSPYETWISALKLSKDPALPAALSNTMFVFLSGYGLAILFAIPLGLMMGGLRMFGAALEPYVDALSATPRVSFIPLIIVFLGLGFEAKIFIVFLGAVMPILINTYAGVLNSDADLIEMARAAGATQTQVFRKVMLPGALPYVIAGMRVGAGLALINTVVAELYTAVGGLGGLLSIYGNTFRMGPYFVIVLLLAFIGLLTMPVLRFIERRLTRGYSRHSI